MATPLMFCSEQSTNEGEFIMSLDTDVASMLAALLFSAIVGNVIIFVTSGDER